MHLANANTFSVQLSLCRSSDCHHMLSMARILTKKLSLLEAAIAMLFLLLFPKKTVPGLKNKSLYTAVTECQNQYLAPTTIGDDES